MGMHLKGRLRGGARLGASRLSGSAVEWLATAHDRARELAARHLYRDCSPEALASNALHVSTSSWNFLMSLQNFPCHSAEKIQETATS